MMMAQACQTPKPTFFSLPGPCLPSHIYFPLLFHIGVTIFAVKLSLLMLFTLPGRSFLFASTIILNSQLFVTLRHSTTIQHSRKTFQNLLIALSIESYFNALPGVQDIFLVFTLGSPPLNIAFSI